MKGLLAALLVAPLTLAAAVTEAQMPMRVRGTITALDGNVLSVKTREGKDIKVELSDKTAVAAVQAVKLADIKPGDAVGTATRRAGGGSLTALEVHVLPANMPIPNEGHRLDLEQGSMMTNARVTAVVQATSGRELTLTYKDGAQKIVVPEGVPVVTAVPPIAPRSSPASTSSSAPSRALTAWSSPPGASR